MEDKKVAPVKPQTLESLYNEITDEFIDLTFKYMTDAPQNEIDTENKSATESIQAAKGNPDPAKPAKTDHASRLHGSGSGQDPARRAEPEIKNERQARSSGIGRGFIVASKSGMAMPYPYEWRADQRQRKGNPHSNICALCDSDIRFFRHRCLVCGRVYCKKCVGTGMGEMTEGRKCLDCLGRRFSQRYIERAGTSGCCSGYPSKVKRQELIWAEKGASSRTEENYERKGSGTKENCEKNGFVLNSNNPVIVATPVRTPSGDKPAFIITSTAAFNSSHGISFQGM